MIPSRPVDWLTKTPRIEKVRYPTKHGEAEGDLYRPGSDGPHPAIVVCLGVVPFEVDHPQVPVLGRALARAGFTALLYWSPAMRDFRFDADDIENIALAYNWLVDQPGIQADKSGILGTCVGGSFALMAAAHPLVRDRVAFVSAYAPYSSMPIFARDIASSTRSGLSGREPWKVDQLTRKVFVYSIAAWLEPAEAERIRDGFAVAGSQFDGLPLSVEGEAVRRLLSSQDESQAEGALNDLPEPMREMMVELSPVTYLDDIHTPLMVLLHDRGDMVIPIGESYRLVAALDGRAGVQFTEMQFSHLDPSKGKLPLHLLIQQFSKFFRAVYPLFRQAVE